MLTSEASVESEATASRPAPTTTSQPVEPRRLSARVKHSSRERAPVRRRDDPTRNHFIDSRKVERVMNLSRTRGSRHSLTVERSAGPGASQPAAAGRRRRPGVRAFLIAGRWRSWSACRSSRPTAGALELFDKIARSTCSCPDLMMPGMTAWSSGGGFSSRTRISDPLLTATATRCSRNGRCSARTKHSWTSRFRRRDCTRAVFAGALRPSHRFDPQGRGAENGAGPPEYRLGVDHGRAERSTGTRSKTFLNRATDSGGAAGS